MVKTEASSTKPERRCPMPKLAIIDGCSLNHIAWDAGYAGIHFRNLYERLLAIGKEPYFLMKPIYTHLITFREADFVKEAIKAGFQPCLTKRGRDDQLIIDAIDMISRDRVQELILLSQDSDFYDAVMRKVARGVQVYWVGAEYVRHKGLTPSLSPYLRRLFGKNPEFVELIPKDQTIFHTPQDA